MKIANENQWQQQHLKSLQSAYSMSPFFEFYIDDLMPLFKKQFDFILDYNLHCFEFVLDALQCNIKTAQTTSFEKQPEDKMDFRSLVNRNHQVNKFENYTQVFSKKHGFISNLSILDVLFNEGPNTELYLKNQTL